MAVVRHSGDRLRTDGAAAAARRRRRRPGARAARRRRRRAAAGAAGAGRDRGGASRASAGSSSRTPTAGRWYAGRGAVATRSCSPTGRSRSATGPGGTCLGAAAAGQPVPDVLHAPTPTDEPLDLPALLLGSFPLDPTRRHVAPGPLTDALVQHAADAYVELATGTADPLALLPSPVPAGRLDGALREAIVAALRESPFLVATDGSRVAPRDATTVLGADDDLRAAAGRGARPAGRPTTRRSPGSAPAGCRSPRSSRQLADLSRPPAWWRDLYAALDAAGVRDPDGALGAAGAAGRRAAGPRTARGAAAGRGPARRVRPRRARAAARASRGGARAAACGRRRGRRCALGARGAGGARRRRGGLGRAGPARAGRRGAALGRGRRAAARRPAVAGDPAAARRRRARPRRPTSWSCPARSWPGWPTRTRSASSPPSWWTGGAARCSRRSASSTRSPSPRSRTSCSTGRPPTSD